VKEYYLEFSRENIWHWEYFSSVDVDNYHELRKDWKGMISYGGRNDCEFLKVLLF
jgi:hypothetical protein